jgi:hypothetical protein
MATKRLKQPRDPVELGKLIGDILTGQTEDRDPSSRDEVASAMAAKVTPKFWEMADMVQVLEDWEAAGRD